MPSEAAEKSLRRKQKKTELLTRLPKSQQGSAPVRLSFEEYLEIVQKCLEEVGVRKVEYAPSRTSVKFEMPDTPGDRYMEAKLDNLYEKRKFMSPDKCLQVELACIRNNVLAQAQVADAAEEGPPENLFLTVKTHDFILDKNDCFRHPLRPEQSDRVMFRPFSQGSGELYIAIVIGMESEGSLSDMWIPSTNLKRWNITEEQAFDLAIKNLEAITPPKLNCIYIKSMAELQKSYKTKRRSLTQITHLNFGSRLSGGTLIVQFSDSRALPRLLLPRVTERLAEVLRCDLLSLVIVPFEDSTFVVANAEDRGSMLLMAIHQTLPFCQGDNPHVKHKVSWNPFRLTKLRNEKGLVEMEPYLVNGGRFAVHVWVKDKQKVFYPMPRTKDDIAAVEDIVGNPRKAFATVTEGAFLEGLCWQCRNRFEKLQTCANCRKAKSCSRECQKKAWAEGHNVNCEERRQFWKRVKMCRPPGTKGKAK